MRIVKVRQGFNPNSSSLSVNMAVLLAATGAATWGTLIVATAVQLFRRKDRPAPAPAAPAAPVPPTGDPAP